MKSSLVLTLSYYLRVYDWSMIVRQIIVSGENVCAYLSQISVLPVRATSRRLNIYPEIQTLQDKTRLPREQPRREQDCK